MTVTGRGQDPREIHVEQLSPENVIKKKNGRKTDAEGI